MLFRSEILGIIAEITSDASSFLASELPRLNYSNRRLANEPFIRAHSLLFSTGFGIPEAVPVESDGETGFFPASSDSLLPFDPLASAFLIVSRLEEYQQGSRDMHGRFEATSSLLYRHGLLEKPVVNIWARMLGDRLQQIYPELNITKRPFRFLTTLDIDNAWAFRHKGCLRTSAALIASGLKGDFRDFRHRVYVLSGLTKDPYDTYDYLAAQLDELNSHAIIFFLLGDYGRFDKAISWKNREFRKLIQRLAKRFPLGIHPSWLSASPEELNRLVIEKSRLEMIAGQTVTRSRQHYLRISLPETYRRLASAGIEEDYSMGFADHTGFRAGICIPFRLYDVLAEQELPVTVFPFQVMDVTLRLYMKLSPKDAARKTKELMERVRDAGGIFVGIWHNETVSGMGPWNEYRPVFESMNQMGKTYAAE